MKRLFRKAVEDPIHFPPLSRAVFPGDKVVLVPDLFVLAHGRLLETLIDHLIDYGITPSDITVMMTEQERSLAEKNDLLQALITKKEKKGVDKPEERWYSNQAVARDRAGKRFEKT